MTRSIGPSEVSAERVLPHAVTVLLGVAATVVTVAGMRSFSGTLGTAFLALVLVISVHPVRGWLTRKGWPGWVGSLVAILLVLAVLVGFVASLAYAVAQLITLLPQYSDEFRDLLESAGRVLAGLGVSESQVTDAVDQLSLTSLIGPLQQVLSQVTTIVSGVAFLMTLVFFLVADAAGFTRSLVQAETSHPRLVQPLLGFARSTRSYVLVTTVFGLLVAVINVGELYLLAVPLPLLWGLVSFLSNYIPNVGFFIGLVPPALLALLDSGVGRMLAVVAAYGVVNLVIQVLVQPKIVGDRVGLSSTVTFMSLTVWAFVLGALGALLAVPLSLLVKGLLVDGDPKLQWLRPLLGDNAGSAAPAKSS